MPNDTIKEELLSAYEPKGKPKFFSTRFLIRERSRSRFALECALDYQHHMGEEDVEGIKRAYDDLSYLANHE